MSEQRSTVLHVLAALAYRAQKALRDAPSDFGDFDAGAGVRTPRELVRHMTSVIGYARTYFTGGLYHPEPLGTLQEEMERFHTVLQDFAAHIRNGAPLRAISLEQLLQGPISDAMTHAGQLALLRRLSGSPVAPENFIFAEISPDRLGVDQPEAAAPDSPWLGRLLHLSWLLTRARKRFRRGAAVVAALSLIA